MGKRLANINLENTEENRRQYRQLLMSCDNSMGMHACGEFSLNLGKKFIYLCCVKLGCFVLQMVENYSLFGFGSEIYDVDQILEICKIV